MNCIKINATFETKITLILSKNKIEATRTVLTLMPVKVAWLEIRMKKRESSLHCSTVTFCNSVCRRYRAVGRSENLGGKTILGTLQGEDFAYIPFKPREGGEIGPPVPLIPTALR